MKLALVNRQVILPESGTESFQCHAPTLVRLPCGTLVAAWFAGGGGECCLENLLRWDGVIQPMLWESSPGHIHMLLRSTRGAIFRSDSIDYGATWSVARATSLPNNNSGIDLVSMQDGTLILALNPVNGNGGKRYPLSLIASQDNGESWLPLLDLESDRGEYSYPAIISEGGVVHITYTWNRKNIVYCRLQTV